MIAVIAAAILIVVGALYCYIHSVIYWRRFDINREIRNAEIDEWFYTAMDALREREDVDES